MDLKDKRMAQRATLGYLALSSVPCYYLKPEVKRIGMSQMWMKFATHRPGLQLGLPWRFSIRYFDPCKVPVFVGV